VPWGARVTAYSTGVISATVDSRDSQASSVVVIASTDPSQLQVYVAVSWPSDPHEESLMAIWSPSTV